MRINSLSGRLLLALSLIVLAGPVAAQNATTAMAGVGDSKARPQGRLELPPGVEVAGQIRGHTPYDEENCSNEHEQAQGAGHMVQLCLGLRHTGQGVSPGLPVRVVIPAGTIFISESERTQNGILIRRVERLIRPGETQYLWMHLMCLNANRDSSSTGDLFALGPVLEHPGFTELFRRLEGKTISVEALGDIQAVVWRIAEGESVPARLWATIDQLPPE